MALTGWLGELERVAGIAGVVINNCGELVGAIARRREEFKTMGATATDHGVVAPRTERLDDSDADRIFDKALRCSATEEDEALFEAHLLMEMARLSVDDGLVMQLHAGALRNHNEVAYQRFGSDRGGDIPLAT